MTVDIPTRAPEQLASSEARRGGGRLPRSGRSIGKAPLVVGGAPRANLLPPEIILKRQQLKTRRALRAGVLLVAVATAAGCFATFGVASVAQVQAGIAQQTQRDLVLEQSKFQEVRDVQDTISTIIAGQQVGGSTEIAWREYLTLLQATLPSGVVLDTVKVDTGTPMSAYQQSDAPLQGSRVAALSLSVTSKTLPSVPDWLRAMAKLPGFVDAIPGSVKGSSGSYTIDVVLHINSDAFSMRFDPAHVEAVKAQAEADAAAAAAGVDPISKSLVAGDTTDGAADNADTDGEGN